MSTWDPGRIADTGALLTASGSDPLEESGFLGRHDRCP